MAMNSTLAISLAASAVWWRCTPVELATPESGFL